MNAGGVKSVSVPLPPGNSCWIVLMCVSICGMLGGCDSGLLAPGVPRMVHVPSDGFELGIRGAPGRFVSVVVDQGSFDVAAFLKTLKELGFRGPIGLQCYGIGGDAREHLARSMAAWRKLSKNLE